MLRDTRDRLEVKTISIMKNSRHRKSKSQAIAKAYTAEETRRIVSELYRDESNPESIFEEIAENIIPNYLHGTQEERIRAKYTLLNKRDAVAMTVGLDHHVPLLDVVNKRYAPLLLAITRQLEREYDCTTAMEKMLAEQIGMAHLKIIDHSRQLNDAIELMSRSGGKNIAQQIEVLSRQVDRATRQFYSSIVTLRQLKQPQLAINIRNTFMAQNQQINTVAQKS